MRYRIHPKTGDRISEIGLGSAYLYESDHDEAVHALQTAYEGGINYFDLAAGDARAFPLWGDALGSVRRNVLYQIHFGADYSKGNYGWSLDPEAVRRSVDWQLSQLKTDYIDYGFIHCQDEARDWETYRWNGVWDYLSSLQKQGVVRHLGLSSHTPSVIRLILGSVPVDTLMFSVNPAYDYGQGEFASGSLPERSEIFTLCEKERIAITVMKPFSGGQLLDAARSPFGRAMTSWQCLRYALDKPGVVTVLPGAKDTEEVEELLRFELASSDETDYSIIASFAPPEAGGKCVYCNHCAPCPQGLDVGLINKYYDLALAGDPLASEHYRNLEKNASDCILCGHCDHRCPFHVRQSRRMEEIRRFMDGR